MPNSPSPTPASKGRTCAFFRCQNSLAGRTGSTKYCTPACGDEARHYKERYWDCRGCGLQRKRYQVSGAWCPTCLASRKAQGLGPKEKVSGRVCLYCAGRFHVSAADPATRYQRVCWPCWNARLAQGVQVLRQQAERRIELLTAEKARAAEDEARVRRDFARDTTGWLNELLRGAGSGSDPLTATYHGAQKWQQLLHCIARLSDERIARDEARQARFQLLIEKERLSVNGKELHQSAWIELIVRSREWREEMRTGNSPAAQEKTRAGALARGLKAVLGGLGDEISTDIPALYGANEGGTDWGETEWESGAEKFNYEES